MAISGAAVAYCAIGGLVLFSGIKGATISDTVKAALKGNLTVTGTEPVGPAPGSGGAPAGGGAGGSAATVPASASQAQFIGAVLSGIGAPPTPANIASMTDWMAHEEPPSDWSHWNNPMNTTLSAPGAVSQNSVGVKSYPTLSEGLQATIDTLNNGNYQDILMQLRAGNGLKSGASAGLLKWSGGGYSSV